MNAGTCRDLAGGIIVLVAAACRTSTVSEEVLVRAEAEPRVEQWRLVNRRTEEARARATEEYPKLLREMQEIERHLQSLASTPQGLGAVFLVIESKKGALRRRQDDLRSKIASLQIVGRGLTAEEQEAIARMEQEIIALDKDVEAMDSLQKALIP